MPRHRVRTTVPKYTLEALNTAMNAVRSGRSVYAASKMFGIPESTIRNRFRRNTPDTKLGAGRPTLLPPEIEKELVENIILLSEHHHPLTKDEILRVIHEYCTAMKIKNPFSRNNSLPGEELLYGFCKRHPNITKRKAEALQSARVQCSTKSNYSVFFEALRRKLTELEINDPRQIINLDETGYDTNIATTVIAKKGARSVSQKQPGSGKDTFTVIETVAANGHIFPPVIIYNKKNLYNTWCIGGPEGTGYLVSQNGWQDKKTFVEYFKLFIKWTQNWPKPLLLIFDGHGSHIQFAVSNLAIQNNIHIITLPAHSSQTLQPLDVAVFAPAKRVWMKVKRAYSRESDYKNITKEAFPGLMKQLRDQGGFTPENIRAGFRSAGIWPFDPQKVLAAMPNGSESVTHNLQGNTQLETPPTEYPSTEIQTNKDTQPETISVTASQEAGPSRALDSQRPVLAEISQNLEQNDLTSKNSVPSMSSDSITTLHSAILKVITPKSRPIAGKKTRLTFNNKVLTDEDVMDQMRQKEEEMAKKKNKKRKDLLVPKTSNKKFRQQNTKGEKKKTISQQNNNDSTDTEDEISLHDNSSDDASLFSNNDEDINPDCENMDFEIGQYVVAEYDGKWYIANIIDIVTVNSLKLKFMEPKGTNNFCWPKTADILIVPTIDVICPVNPPIPVSSRYLGLNSEDLEKTKKLWQVRRQQHV